LSCKVEIDELSCLAHGDCAHVAPHAFVVDDIGRHTGEGTRDELVKAAEACPAAAITVTDAETGEQLYP
jgi:ferredoxin